MKTLLKHFGTAGVVTLVIFVAYFAATRSLLARSPSLADFVGSFDPLSAYFTALAFFAIVLTTWYQARETNQNKADIERERNERLTAMIHVTRLHAAGMRLLSMSFEKDHNTAAARRELEIMVEEFERHFSAQMKKEGA